MITTPAPSREKDGLFNFASSRLFGTELARKQVHESEKTTIRDYLRDSYHYRHDEYYPLSLARWVESFGFRRRKVSTFFSMERLLSQTNRFPLLQTRIPIINLLCLNNLHIFRRTRQTIDSRV